MNTPTLYGIWRAFDHDTSAAIRTALTEMGVAHASYQEGVNGRSVMGFMDDGTFFVDFEDAPVSRDAPETTALLERLMSLSKESP